MFLVLIILSHGFFSLVASEILALFCVPPFTVDVCRLEWWVLKNFNIQKLQHSKLQHSTSTFKNFNIQLQHSKTSTFKNFNIQKLQHSKTSTFKNFNIQLQLSISTFKTSTFKTSTFKNFNIQKLQHSKTSTFKNFNIQKLQHSKTSTFKNFNIHNFNIQKLQHSKTSTFITSTLNFNIQKLQHSKSSTFTVIVCRLEWWALKNCARPVPANCPVCGS